MVWPNKSQPWKTIPFLTFNLQNFTLGTTKTIGEMIWVAYGSKVDFQNDFCCVWCTLGDGEMDLEWFGIV